MTAAQLVAWYGTAEAVFVWAAQTQTDLLSHFDLTDEQFDTLKAIARSETP
jgi:hypothetical protein